MARNNGIAKFKITNAKWPAEVEIKMWMVKSKDIRFGDSFSIERFTEKAILLKSRNTGEKHWFPISEVKIIKIEERR